MKSGKDCLNVERKLLELQQTFLKTKDTKISNLRMVWTILIFYVSNLRTQGYLPYSRWGLLDNTHIGRAGSAYNSVISKDMDLKFGMLR